MALKTKRSVDSRKAAASAEAVLDEFTKAARSVQKLGKWEHSGNGHFPRYKSAVKDFEEPLKRAILGNDISKTSRGKMAGEIRPNATMDDLDVLRRSAAGVVERAKGTDYDKAVRRIATLTKDLNKLAKLDLEAAKGDKEKQRTAYYMLQVVMTEFGVPVHGSTTGTNAQRAAQGKESELESDLKIVRKAAVAERKKDNLEKQIKGHVPPVVENRQEQVHKSSTESGNGNGGHAGGNGKTEHKPQMETPEPVVLSSESVGVDNLKKMEQQQAVMEANIQKRFREIEGNAARMAKMSRNDIVAGKLHEKLSDANVKLFVEINAYTDMLMEMKDRIDTMFPNKEGKETDQHKMHSKNIDALVERIGTKGTNANQIMSRLGKDKDFGISRLPMFSHQISNIQNDLYGINDDTGKSLYKMLGANVIAFEEGRGSANMDRQMDAYYREIMEKLNKDNKNVLRDYEREYVDASELVIAQLAAIGVQFGGPEGKGGTSGSGIWKNAHMPYVFRPERQ